MDLEVGVDDYFHTVEANAVCGQAPPLEGRGRVGDIDHHVGPGGRQGTDIDLGHREIEDAVVNRANVAVGATDRDVLIFGDDLGGVACADDRGHTKFAADDGGMDGGTAVVGHDARSPLQDRKSTSLNYSH